MAAAAGWQEHGPADWGEEFAHGGPVGRMVAGAGPAAARGWGEDFAAERGPEGWADELAAEGGAEQWADELGREAGPEGWAREFTGAITPHTHTPRTGARFRSCRTQRIHLNGFREGFKNSLKTKV